MTSWVRRAPKDPWLIPSDRSMGRNPKCKTKVPTRSGTTASAAGSSRPPDFSPRTYRFWRLAGRLPSRLVQNTAIRLAFLNSRVCVSTLRLMALINHPVHYTEPNPVCSLSSRQYMPSSTSAYTPHSSLCTNKQDAFLCRLLRIQPTYVSPASRHRTSHTVPMHAS
jgi:hypothetical protein